MIKGGILVDFCRLDNYLESLIGEKIPGLSLIIDLGDNRVYNKNFGYSDRENKVLMNGTEIFNFYSMTKPITCVAALQLFESGKYLLNDPLYEFIPEFKDICVKRDDGNVVKSEKPILIKDLFNMTSGYDYTLDESELAELRNLTNGRLPTLDVVKLLAKRPLLFTPGEKWQYGLSHDILAAFVEVLSGKCFSDYVKDNIFDPLGMQNSFFRENRMGDKKISPQYLVDIKTNSSSRISSACDFRFGTEYDSGGAGLISNVEDYSRFAKALADGKERLLSNATLDLMKTNHLNEKQLLGFDWKELKGYGYGLGVRTLTDKTKAGSNSTLGEFGWNGSAGSFLLVDTEKKLSVTYAQHVLAGYASEIHLHMKNIIYSSI